jgi:glycosyltransferase involved in cell wall biosynthesis
VRILIVSSSFFPKIDGSTRCVYDHARKLAARGHLVYLITRGIEGMPREEVFEGIHVVRTEVTFRSGNSINKARLMLEQVATILRFQRRFKFQVVHVHGYASGLAAMPCRYMFGVPLVITTHGTEFLWPRELWWKSRLELRMGLIFERQVLEHVDIVIAQSEGVRKYMLEIYGRDIGPRIRIVPTGVDHTKFAVPEGLPDDDRVMFVGALTEVKGVACLLKAFGEVHDEFPRSSLILVGSGPRAEYYKEMVQEMGLLDSVEFLGAVRDDARLLQLYRESSIVVLPSNVGGPISCTLLEGMSCGRAVISTNVPGGIPDVLGEGAGLLMKRNDEMELASYLRRLFSDRAYEKQLARTARERVENSYTLDMMTSRLLSLYSEVAS